MCPKQRGELDCRVGRRDLGQRASGTAKSVPTLGMPFATTVSLTPLNRGRTCSEAPSSGVVVGDDGVLRQRSCLHECLPPGLEGWLIGVSELDEESGASCFYTSGMRAVAIWSVVVEELDGHGSSALRPPPALVVRCLCSHLTNARQSSRCSKNTSPDSSRSRSLSRKDHTEGAFVSINRSEIVGGVVASRRLHVGLGPLTLGQSVGMGVERSAQQTSPVGDHPDGLNPRPRWTSEL